MNRIYQLAGEQLCLMLIFLGAYGSVYGQYHIREVQLPENLRRHSIHCQLQTSKGLMLFGTSEGLYQYDGWRFDHISGDSMLSQNITAVFEDADETIWVGTETGVIGRAQQCGALTLEPWLIEEGHPHVRITSILRDKAGSSGLPRMVKVFMPGLAAGFIISMKMTAYRLTRSTKWRKAPKKAYG